jgi:TatD DNase family protein
MKFFIRNAADTFRNILRVNRHKFQNGVISCVEGNEIEITDFLEDGLSIGISSRILGSESMCEMVGTIPLDKMLLESNSPWNNI